MSRLRFLSENSAQATSAKANPFIAKVIHHLQEVESPARNLRSLVVADQGCGKLRHLRLLMHNFDRVVLVDSRCQLERVQTIAGQETSIMLYVSNKVSIGSKLCLLDAADFSRERLNLHIIFCCCVFDVVPLTTRKLMITAAARNLASKGIYCVIVPRNDQSILRRCLRKNRYHDGHMFRKGRFFTFYANFAEGSRPLSKLLKLLDRAGLQECANLSVHRQLCLLFKKP
jgi:hypothetical protein